MRQVQSFISKKKEKDGTEVVGNLIKAKTAKSRLVRRTKMLRFVFIMMNVVLIGTMVYLNLVNWVDFGRTFGRYEMNGKKVYAKEILKNPDKYFTEEVLQKLDEVKKKSSHMVQMMFFLNHTVKN